MSSCTSRPQRGRIADAATRHVAMFLRLVVLLACATRALAQTPASITLSAMPSTFPIGQASIVQAVVRDATGNVLANAPLTWSSNAPEKASVVGVGQLGFLSGHESGTATITARTANGISNQVTVTVQPVPPTPPQSSNIVLMYPESRLVMGNSQVTVRISWCGFPPPNQNIMDVGSRVIRANGVDVTGNFDLQFDPSACGYSGPVADETLYSSTGTITVDETTGPVVLTADVSNGYGYHWTGVAYLNTPNAQRGVQVVADQQFVSALPSSIRSERFTVTNTGSAHEDFTLTATGCGSGAIATACTLNPASPLSLAAGASAVVTASYTTSATAGTAGLIRLRAKSPDEEVRDSSWTDVTVSGAQAAGVSIAGMAPGNNDILDRGACLTLALTSEAATECGDLRLVHGLPTVRTMATVKAPTLLYNSQHARPKPIVLADITLSSGAPLPTSVTACIKIAGTSRGCGSWPGSNWGSPGSTRRVAIPGDDGGWTTGATELTVEVSASNQGPYAAAGRIFIVNRSASSFGAGWWLAGLEKLVVVSGTELVWIGGDGSARRYVKTGSVWRAPKFAALDSIVAAGTGYVRRTADHARIYFNAAGQHDSTVNILGHTTRFEYTSGLLTKIRIPKPSGAWFDYTLVYSGGQLDCVYSGDGRATKIFHTLSRVDSIRDPDGSRVRFTSGTGLDQYVVTGRTDRRGNTTTFAYDAGHRIAHAARPLSSTLTIAAAETKGLSVPVPLDSAFAQVDGPRSDVSDVTRFWVNAYGAPIRVRNALGQEQRIRFSSTWPGLADSVIAANRLVSRAYYDPARGLVDSVRVINPLGTGTDAVTKYRWSPQFNQVTSVRTPTGSNAWLVDSLSYNSDGTLLWRQRGTGTSANRVNFTYTADKLPQDVILPAAPIKPDTTTYFYDALGNVRKQRSPTGLLTLSFGDAAGRDTLLITPRGTGIDATDSAQVVAKGVKQRMLFDRMNRDTLASTTSPSVTLPNGRVVPGDTIKVRSTFDEEGNRRTLTRSYTAKLDPSQNGLYQMLDARWDFDALNRLYHEEDPAGGESSYTLDPAGNAIATLTPRGHTITATYDALNRVTRRVVPQVNFSGSSCHYPLAGNCYYNFPTMESSPLCVAADSLRYGYDAAGNMTQADNNWARIRRVFAPNGLVTSETQAFRQYMSSNPAPCGGGDRHNYADTYNYSRIYRLRYEYDLAGRRTKLIHPDEIDACSGACAQTYAYDAVTGLLDTLRHPSPSGGTLTTTFGYDDQLRLTATNHPGGVTTTQTYDGESRLLTRDGPRTNDDFTRDATGRVIGGSVQLASTGGSRAISFGYSGMGALQWAQGMTDGVDYEEYKTDALGNRLWVRDFNVVEGIDRTRYQAYAAERGQLTGMELGTGSCGPGGVPHASCHPYWYFYQFQQSHDASGNVDATWQLDTRGTDAASAEPVTDETRSYYAADEKLVYQDRRVGNGYYAQAGSGFEEYRYDALGRRILTRSRRAAGCAYPCEAYVQRAVWDGDQVLYELRTSGGQGVDSSYFEMDAGVATGDDPNLYGIVAYAHAEAAQGIDQPVGILKKVPSTGWAYVTPHTNWKGDWSYGTFSDGTLCLTTGATCPTWPGFTLTMDRASQGVTPPSYTVWWGNLIRGAADGSGLVYQRNRYYDPKTGRFTQVDPIGLAGGLNAYGFASGDPVSYNDPFGLRGCDRQHPEQCTFRDMLGNFVIGLGAFTTPGHQQDVGPGWRTGAFLSALSMFVRAPAGAVVSHSTVVIGAMEHLDAPGALGAGERTLKGQLSPDLGSAAANWARNERVLLNEMERGYPIRDASVNPDGSLMAFPDYRFIAKERELLRSRGWEYNQGTRLWTPGNSPWST